MNFEEQKQGITDALNERGANKPCPRCTNEDFFVLDGYINPFVVQDYTHSHPSTGGPSIPIILTACTNCGFLSLHALGLLGLLKKPAQDRVPTEEDARSSAPR